MDVVGQINLPGERCGKGNQQAGISHVAPGNPCQIAENNNQCKHAADGSYAFARQDCSYLRPQCIAQTLLETRMPQPIVVPIASRDVVPSRVGVGRHAVACSLLLQVSICHRATHQVLQAQKHDKDSSVDARQPCINCETQHDGIEYQAEKEFQVRFKFIHQLKKYLKGFIG